MNEKCPLLAVWPIAGIFCLDNIMPQITYVYTFSTSRLPRRPEPYTGIPSHSARKSQHGLLANRPERSLLLSDPPQPCQAGVRRFLCSDISLITLSSLLYKLALLLFGKKHRLRFHRDFDDLITIITQLLFVFQKRVIQRYTCNLTDFIKGQCQFRLAAFMNVHPKCIIFAHMLHSL